MSTIHYKPDYPLFYDTLWFFVTLSSNPDIPSLSLQSLLHSVSIRSIDTSDDEPARLIIGCSLFDFLMDQITLETLAGSHTIWIPSYVINPQAKSTLECRENLFPGVDPHSLYFSPPLYSFHRRVAHAIRASPILTTPRRFYWGKGEEPCPYPSYDTPHFFSYEEIVQIATYIQEAHLTQQSEFAKIKF